MPVLPRQIIAPAQLTNASATYYTAPAATRCVIKKITCFNADTAARTVTIYLIPSGGAAADSTTIVKTKSIPAGMTVEIVEAGNHVLEAAGFINALADVGSKVTIQGSGYEQS